MQPPSWISSLTNLSGIRRLATLPMLCFVASHTPVIAALGYLLKTPEGPQLTAASLGVSVLALGVFFGRSRIWAHNAIAVLLMAQVTLIVMSVHHHPYHEDAHFYYFACLGILAIFIRQSVIITANVAAAFYLLLLLLWAPTYAFHGQSDFWRFAMHVWIMMLETSVLSVLCWIITATMRNAEKATAQAEEALQQVRVAEEQRAAMRTESETERKRLLSSMANEFEQGVQTAIDYIRLSIETLFAHAQSMASIAATTKDKSISVAQAAQASYATTEHVATAAEQLSQSIRSINEEIHRSTATTDTATHQAEYVRQALEMLVQRIQQVNSVTGFITEVATQTNLLALNATIEAARAGEAGKGFAVVAGEVKSLAGQTTHASDEIVQQIEKMQEASRTTEQAVQAILASIHDVNKAIVSIAEAIANQSQATNKISQNVEESANYARAVTTTIAEVETEAGHTSESSQNIVQAAENLQRQSETLQTEVDQFLTRLRQS